MATLRRLGEAPRHLLVCERSDFSHHTSRHRHLVEAHYHNYRVSFLIPECEILPKQLKSLVKETGPNYCVKNLPLQKLNTHEFINTFVRKGLKSLTGAVSELLPLALYHLSQTSMTGVALHCDPLNCDSSLLSSCYALTFNTYIDEDNTVGLLPNDQIQKHHPKVELSTVNNLQCLVLQSSELKGERASQSHPAVPRTL
ncbi:LOW QUALITY PROTEIN: ribonuclease P protein subunit p40 [Dipodomys spectabilis]|uniref:LOW QUALITY PROTEIN: ribonuclease P protein subunit p40 n=1 Tax=Dipodomys spectabilis TaxID=105255 RepID=UPI001C545298|nr:LOW QUALITY PROTEIN: ribonuclease P protein subunit p40 [Dipodomys spectabilis]